MGAWASVTGEVAVKFDGGGKRSAESKRGARERRNAWRGFFCPGKRVFLTKIKIKEMAGKRPVSRHGVGSLAPRQRRCGAVSIRIDLRKAANVSIYLVAERRKKEIKKK